MLRGPEDRRPEGAGKALDGQALVSLEEVSVPSVA